MITQRDFCRKFYAKNQAAQIAAFEAHPLYPMLMADIAAGQVFPAIRKDAIDFYYKGLKLCTFCAKSFIWFEQTDVSDQREYESLKANICVHPKSHGERGDLFALCQRFSPYVQDHANRDFVLLDIEVGFSQQKDSAGCLIQSKVTIDRLFLDLRAKQLVFVEGKCAGDSRIANRKSERSEVFTQLEKYDRNLSAQRATISQAYEGIIPSLNRIFHSDLPEAPLQVSQPTKLFVYGLADDAKLQHLRSQLGANLIVHRQVDALNYNDIRSA